MNTGPTLPSSALTVGWHPDTDDDLDLLRDELDACVAEIARLRAALATAEAMPGGWPYCGRCGEGEDAEECEGCGDYGCDVCVVRGLCVKCVEAGVE